MFRTILVSLLITCTLLIGSLALTSNAQKPTRSHDQLEIQREVDPAVAPQQIDVGQPRATLTAYANQITKTQVDSPDRDDVVTVVNVARSSADVDFVAIDTDGNEVARETGVVGPKLKARFKVQNLFPQLSIGDLSSIEIQASVRPVDGESIPAKRQGGIVAQGQLMVAQSQLPVAFFSQRDSRWASNQLGTCSKTTIGTAGCGISCIAMAGARSVYNFNPATLNTYLTKNGGYSQGCLVYWSAAAKIDGSGGFTYIGTGSVNSAANLKSLIDGNKFAIARSARFTSHFGIIIGYNGLGTKLSDFYYLDPWDLSATFRKVGDGWVTATSATQIYQ